MSTPNWNALLYSSNSKFQYCASKKFLNNIDFSNANTILDVGCGHGYLTFDIAKKNPNTKVFAIDQSKNMLEYAKKHFTLPNLKFIYMNAEDITFTQKVFDIILSTFCLHWVPNKLKAFESMKSHLARQGKLLLIMPIPNRKMAEIRNHACKQNEWKSFFEEKIDHHIPTFNNNYFKLAKLAGFTNIDSRTIENTIEFESQEKFCNFIKSISPCISSLPNEYLKDKFINQIVGEYITNSNTKGMFNYHVKTITLSAQA